ncbi:MAG: T9SS type A sorting domain-containing protein [Flavobacteriales bacterium]|nr:T9SS type A sorting domain-containing protein [Flavobacteriales bacterium]
MKKTILIVTISGVLTLTMQAQNRIQIPNHLQSHTKVISQKITDKSSHPNLLYAEENYGPISNQKTEYANGIVEEIIGHTYYDLQTNNSIQNRLLIHNDKSISNVWTMNPSNDRDAEFPNRGTGYNYFDGSSWQTIPLNRIESEKTGWPSIAELNNLPIISAHSNKNEKITWTSKIDLTTDRWTESKSVSKEGQSSSVKQMWPRLKVGGPDGKTIHAIAHTYNNGVDSNLIAYNRSLDGGGTWDIVDSILPGTGREFFTGIDADAYAMDVRGETVAFVLGDKWTDIVLMKSTDNGTTWTKTIIRDHPITKFNDDVIVNETTHSSSNGTIDNTDGSFSISLDANNNAHVFFGLMKYSNKALNDNNWEYYPLTDGIMYWNEKNLSMSTITGTIDLNQDNILNVESKEQISDYGSRSLTSYPNSAFAENGDLYLSYSGIVESLYADQIEAGNSSNEKYLQHYRHPYLIKSEDNGNTWSKPIDLMAEITNPITGDPLQEGVFACIGNLIDDFIHLTYQRDHLPGLNITGDKDPVTKNEIVHLKIPVTVFNLSTEEVKNSSNDFQMYPNPTRQGINIRLNSNDRTAWVKIINVLGEEVATKKIKNAETHMNIEKLKPGIYHVSIETDTQKMVRSLVKN